ncbi:zymogen granule membrane protein 16-like isoform X2 [Conger conger]|nr:zymogen granule membrane protein 16-like isoform X2 [Conger conger]
MISIFIFCLCCLTAGAKNLPYHFSGAVGRGSGTPFTSDPPNTGTGRITGVKVWELNNGYIRGLQIKHDYNWGELFGRNTDIEHEFILFEREVIVQVSGKYNPGNWIYLLTFGTNWGRTFTVGQASGISFNFFQDYPLQELVMVSGRFDNNGLTSIAAHWGILDLGYTGKNESDVAHH